MFASLENREQQKAASRSVKLIFKNLSMAEDAGALLPLHRLTRSHAALQTLIASGGWLFRFRAYQTISDMRITLIQTHNGQSLG